MKTWPLVLMNVCLALGNGALAFHDVRIGEAMAAAIAGFACGLASMAAFNCWLNGRMLA